METQSIVILDFGAQYSQLIARRVRDQKVHSVVLPCTASLAEIQAYRPIGIILSGGPSSVYDKDAPPMDDRVLTLGAPILGICYGLQVIAYKLGGKVVPATKREYGHADIQVLNGSSLFAGLPREMSVWMSHGDEAQELPAGFSLVAKTANAVAAIENPAKKIWAVQFHPEVHHTKLGKELLHNFVFDICGARGDWTPAHFIQSTVEQVRKQVGEKGSAICGLSGGVDSSVAAALVHQAIGDRLTCVFVNNGVLRKDEFAKVQKNLRDKLGLNVVAVDAGKRFLAKLAGVTEPEKKRKNIGNEFIAVFDDAVEHLLQGDLPHNATVVANEKGLVQCDGRPLETRNSKLETIDFLVQGTLYPDVIESRSVRGPSQTIKTHHNVGGLPEKMKLKLIEPLKDLFKDEVRRIGKDLGLPDELLQRQPFPGPGLAVRILGEVTAERVAMLQEADEIVVAEIKQADLYTKIWQSFAVLLPVMTVGVMGDMRTYAYTCAIRCVHSEDGMTADIVELPWDVLKRISTRIVNEVKGINRVVYDTTSKPPGTIEWE
ncbi:MAG: glutamine-hydrolyzing GMP synthase [Candidatus Koribacter versatilis]|uniref:GMP synthase [glutamine-hydrolyzing] n=1 Tax=Candidatus Korobacter versatilis TaxID=658062 RepID=A0A932EP54_9BACT|nr:glutamine-hydrolyzing GMP synthase [Candidatus Koribacter versatilis]